MNNNAVEYDAISVRFFIWFFSWFWAIGEHKNEKYKNNKQNEINMKLWNSLKFYFLPANGIAMRIGGTPYTALRRAEWNSKPNIFPLCRCWILFLAKVPTKPTNYVVSVSLNGTARFAGDVWLPAPTTYSNVRFCKQMYRGNCAESSCEQQRRAIEYV